MLRLIVPIQTQVSPETHRHRLDHGYYPFGNEDKDHSRLFPIIPTMPAVADRVYTDPYDSTNHLIININGAEFYFGEHERLLKSDLTRILKGKIYHESDSFPTGPKHEL